jgi:hypothetical protein
MVRNVNCLSPQLNYKKNSPPFGGMTEVVYMIKFFSVVVPPPRPLRGHPAPKGRGFYTEFKRGFYTEFKRGF